MTLAARTGWVAALLAFVPAILAAQAIQGRVLDAARRPVVGALIELQDSTGTPLLRAISAASGGFRVIAPRTGHFRFRVAAIGYVPHPSVAVMLAATDASVGDIVMEMRPVELSSLVARTDGKKCSGTPVSPETFTTLLESARTTLQVAQAAIDAGAVGFDVVTVLERIPESAVLTTRRTLGLADTSYQHLVTWPVASINPDTLRIVGFARTLDGQEATRQFYGPDARVLFADWFLDSHCFSLAHRLEPGGRDTVRMRFVPAGKPALVDVAGEMVFAPASLALVRFDFALQNLPSWMSGGSTGGSLRFHQLQSALWVVNGWTFSVPMITESAVDRHHEIGGSMVLSGWVRRVTTDRDTSVLARPRLP